MAGKRMIHDKICESRKVNSIDFYAECVWIRLMTKADDNGNYFRDVRRIHANCMIEKEGATEKATERALVSLIRVGLLSEYEADGRKYVHISDFHKHQSFRADRPVNIEHPPHPESSEPDGYTRTGIEQSVRREVADNRQPGDNQRFRVGDPEVEVKDKVEGKVEADGNQLDTDGFREGNFNKFREAWKEATGRATKPKPYTTHVERYQELCHRYGEDSTLDAINDYIEIHGKRETATNKFAERDFLFDEAEDLIKHKASGVPVSSDRLPILTDPAKDIQ